MHILLQFYFLWTGKKRQFVHNFTDFFFWLENQRQKWRKLSESPGARGNKAVLSSWGPKGAATSTNVRFAHLTGQQQWVLCHWIFKAVQQFAVIYSTLDTHQQMYDIKGMKLKKGLCTCFEAVAKRFTPPLRHENQATAFTSCAASWPHQSIIQATLSSSKENYFLDQNKANILPTCPLVH